MIYRRLPRQARLANGRVGSSALELVVATLLAGMVMAAAMQTFASSLRKSADDHRRMIGERIARDLMTEIRTREFEDPTGDSRIGLDSEESREDRSTWDDVDDYHGLSEKMSQVADGSELDSRWESADSSSQWLRTVSVRHIDPMFPTTGSTSRTGIKEISVVVFHAGREVSRLVGYSGAVLANESIAAAVECANEADDTHRGPIAVAEPGSMSVPIEPTLGNRTTDIGARDLSIGGGEFENGVGR